MDTLNLPPLRNKRKTHRQPICHLRHVAQKARCVNSRRMGKAAFRTLSYRTQRISFYPTPERSGITLRTEATEM